ncbi:MAG TPA: hypothetical protein VFC63_28850 [Blastocatellia bacterium]|nr:hypothetical protein [Blastocatellia bacterium]
MRIISGPTRFGLVMLLILWVPILTNAQQSKTETDWSAMKFLIGDWTGDGGGKPGQGSGESSFKLDLQGKVLVRRSQSDYPATADKPAISHSDLMIIHPKASGKGFEAIYFDNEGFVIHYDVIKSDDKKVLTLISEPSPSAPRFRLVYTQISETTMTVRFDIAPPGKPEAFAKYVEGTLHRKAS